MPDSVHDINFGSTTIKQVMDVNHSSEATEARGRISGGVASSEIYGHEAAPVTRITNGDISTVITALLAATSGLYQYVSSGSIVVPWQKKALGGIYGGDGTNFTLTGTDGFLMVTDISASHGDPDGAKLQTELHWLSTDGLTDPVTTNVDQNLSAGSFNASYVLGPCSVNGSEVGRIVSAAVNPGLQVDKRKYGPETYVRDLFVIDRSPSLRLTFEDFDAVDSFSAAFGVITAAVVHFRKRADGGTVVAGATTAHCRFALGAGLWINESLTAQARQQGQATVVLQGKALTSSGASAISL